MSEAVQEKVSDTLSRLAASITGLRIEVEAWRTHTGSTGYFLQVAVEDLIKVVNELSAYLNDNANKTLP